MAPELILHHYDFSCFSEKVRLVLGIKGLRWRSVSIPPTLPKPDYMPLTGGYRRAPALQIGADVFCDSVRIIEELEERFPEPSIYSGPPGPHHHEQRALAAALSSEARPDRPPAEGHERAGALLRAATGRRSRPARC